MQKVTIEFREAAGASGSFLERLAYALLLPLPLLLPVFFIPSLSFPIPFTKMTLLSLAVLVSFGCLVIVRLKDGRFVLPRSPLLIAGGAVLLVAVISALFSGALRTAFIGQALETGTVASLAVMFLLTLLVPILFHSRERIFYAYLLFLAGFILVALFHILRFALGASFAGFGVFSTLAATPVGGWNDLAVFFGVGTVLSLVTLELISLNAMFRALAYATLVLSLFFLAAVNFAPVWYVVGLFSLIFLVYIISCEKSETGGTSSASDSAAASLRKVPLTSLSVLLISLVFILGGTTIGGAIAERLNIVQIEARPSWAATLSVAQNVLARDPFLGAGPNRFAEEWALHKPDGINKTLFWNTDFNYGIGFVPTFLVTTGALGALAWLAFLGLFLYAGFKAILSSMGNKVSRYLVSSSFLVSLFLWIISVFYIPNVAMMALTFFFTGLFIASLQQSGFAKPYAVSFADDPRKGFVSVLVLILFLIGAIALGYAFVEKFTAAVYHQKGVVLYNTQGALERAETAITKAVSLDPIPAYYRSLVQIDLLRISNLLAQNPSTVSADSIRAQFQSLLTAALTHAQQAVALGGSDYKNWLSLGQVYEAVVPLKAQNAYESARGAYEQALSRSPRSPSVLLTLARLETTRGDNAKAKEYIGRALQEKNNYTDAIFLLSQIQVAEGNLKDAIDSVQAASLLSPNDSGIFFQLGFLRYNNKDYQGTRSAMEQAIALNSNYANAKYFLGLAYAKLGRRDDAIKQFTDLKATNPDNKELDLILTNLRAGRDPLTNAADKEPEKRKTPPVSERSGKKPAADADL